ncbi:MAG: efflux RND transporter periplasmic adaptor subunit [Planctomycetaceae bacterium]
MQRPRVAPYLAAMGGMLAVLWGCDYELAGTPGANAKRAKRLKVVTLVRPRVQSLQQTTTQPANVHAFQQAEIHAKVSGYLSKLHVDIGQHVTQDATLAVIDVPEMRKSRETQAVEIERLVAIEARRDAEKSLAVANQRAAEALRDQAKAQVLQWVPQVNADRVERNRVKKLVAAKSVAADLLDEAEKRYQASMAAKVTAESAWTSAKTQVQVAKEKIKVAEQVKQVAEVETRAARAKLAELDELMKYATLKARFAGVITERNVDKGDLIRNMQTASEKPQPPLFVVADISQVRVHVAVPENAAPLVKVGATVVLMLRSLPGRKIDCNVTRMSRSLDERTRTMLVEIVVPNPSEKLLPGMYGEATITLKQKPKALVLLAGAVRFDKTGNASVYVVGKDDTVRIVPVKTGVDFGDEIEITDGLKVDDRVVGPMIGRLQSGQKVRVRTN